MILDRAERITIKATADGHFVLIAIRDGQPFSGAVAFDGDVFTLARLLRLDFKCPVTVWIGSRNDPSRIEFVV